jgi:hypothetical protein
VLLKLVGRKQERTSHMTRSEIFLPDAAKSRLTPCLLEICFGLEVNVESYLVCTLAVTELHVTIMRILGGGPRHLLCHVGQAQR